VGVVGSCWWSWSWSCWWWWCGSSQVRGLGALCSRLAGGIQEAAGRRHGRDDKGAGSWTWGVFAVEGCGSNAPPRLLVVLAHPSRRACTLPFPAQSAPAAAGSRASGRYAACRRCMMMPLAFSLCTHSFTLTLSFAPTDTLTLTLTPPPALLHSHSRPHALIPLPPPCSAYAPSTCPPPAWAHAEVGALLRLAARPSTRSGRLAPIPSSASASSPSPP
jgi:hypothetical protein